MIFYNLQFCVNQCFSSQYCMCHSTELLRAQKSCMILRVFTWCYQQSCKSLPKQLMISKCDSYHKLICCEKLGTFKFRSS